MSAGRRRRFNLCKWQERKVIPHLETGQKKDGHIDRPHPAARITGAQQPGRHVLARSSYSIASRL
jgi:hypothetical protein